MIKSLPSLPPEYTWIFYVLAAIGLWVVGQVFTYGAKVILKIKESKENDSYRRKSDEQLERIAQAIDILASNKNGQVRHQDVKSMIDNELGDTKLDVKNIWKTVSDIKERQATIEAKIDTVLTLKEKGVI